MMEVKGQGEDKVSTEEAYWMGTLQVTINITLSFILISIAF